MSVFLIVKQHPQLHADECGQALFQSYTGNNKIQVSKKLYLEGRRKFDTRIDIVKADIQLHKIWHLAIK
jgi:hypothetical protein